MEEKRKNENLPFAKEKAPENQALSETYEEPSTTQFSAHIQSV